MPLASSTTKIKYIKIKTSSDLGAGCDKCLRLKVCQSESCCSTEVISKELKWLYSPQNWPNDKLGNCKDFPIDMNLPIEFTFNHETSDGWKGEEASVHLHQNEQKPYKCPISEWLDDAEGYPQRYTTNCESPFTPSVSPRTKKCTNY